jgi:ribokinase
MADWDILGIGGVAVDDLVYVDRYPPVNVKMEACAMVRQGGGLTATALVAAARLGARVAFSNVLGDDELSRYTIQELEREGVDCRLVVRQDGARPFHAVVVVEQASGYRTILFTRQGVAERRPEEMTAELIGRGRVLFIDSTVDPLLPRAVEVAHAQNIPVVADFEHDTGPGMRTVLRQIDHLIVGVEFAERVTGERQPERMVRALAGARQACCVVTAGDQGCWYAEWGGPVRYFPAFKVPVVDTTGCGDVFHGAYAACVARGEPVPAAIRVATATAALKATRPGGRAGIPDRATVEEFLSGSHAIHE